MSIHKYINKIFDITSKENPVSLARKFSLYPITDQESYRFFSQQENIHWSTFELDFIEDKSCYDKSDPKIQRLVDIILAFFLPGDGLISSNIIRFLLECNSYEEQAMFISQMHIELIHAETYALIAKTFKNSDEEILELIESYSDTPCISAKLKFMEEWMLCDSPRWKRLLAAACAEGIFFCVLFACIFWLRSCGLFKNFIAANEMISRDESLHRDFNLMLYGKEVNKILLPYLGTPEFEIRKLEIEEESRKIILEALKIEDQFSDEILSLEIEDLNKEDLKIYTRVVIDNFLSQIGLDTMFNHKSPFTWMNDISLQQKGNFYEVKIGAYSKTSLKDAIDVDKRAGRKEIENPFKKEVNFGELDEEIDYENL